MRRGLLLLVLFAVSLTAQAQFTRGDFSLSTATGQAVSGAQVYILGQPANTSTFTPLTSVFGSPTGSGTALCGGSSGVISDPLTTDQFGHACGYVSPGTYTVCYVSSRTATQCYPDQNFPGSGGQSGTFSVLLTLDPWVDPRMPQFGGSCANNPAIDDSTAISNALLVAQASGLEVQISGICWIQNPIIWPNTGISNDRGFGLRGAATGGTIKAMTSFANSGTQSALILRTYTNAGPASEVTLRDITLDANSTASACATFEAQRLLFLDKVECLSATGNGGGELNFGRSAGGSGLVGLTARDIEIDNGGIVATLGAASRPNYGIYMNNNATDGDISNVNVNQTAIAGVYVNSGPNKFASIHPWGFSSITVPPSGTWPQYGIYLDTHAFGNGFVNTQCDTVQLGCFFAGKGFFSAFNTVVECNDGGTGALCGPYIAVAAATAGRINLFGGRFQGGSIVPTGSPVNWLGSIDTCSQWFVEWPVQQWGCGTSNSVILNPILEAAKIHNPQVTGSLDVPGGVVNVSSSTGNPLVLVSSPSTSAFPFYAMENGTNEWLMQVGGTFGNWELQDQSTNNIVVHIEEGAPANSLAIAANGQVTLNNGLRFNQIFQAANGNFANTCVMASGACSAQTFTHAFNFAPVCTCSWTGSGTLTGAIKCPSTTTTVTPASAIGTDTAVIGWICVGQPN